MPIQWFPGHMHKAHKEIKKTLSSVDVIIEILDARIPSSSANPLIDRLASSKPLIKLLNKADLADTRITREWQQYLEQTHGVKSLLTSTDHADQSNQIPRLIRKLADKKASRSTTVNALITGIPNVGKSTIINRLAGKAMAKTGNEPAVTRSQQRIRISDNIMLHDTPGILWPKIENENSAYRLAITNAIRDAVTDVEDVALFAADYLLDSYPEYLRERYQLTGLPADANALLEMVARKRGCLRAGGQIAYDKAASVFLADIRSGKLGKISLETPAHVQSELTG